MDTELIQLYRMYKVLAIAGTGRGADTVSLIRPAYTASLLDLRIKQVLCKPSSW